MIQTPFTDPVKAAFDSVNLINGIIAGTQMHKITVKQKVDIIERNVEHLNIMISDQMFIFRMRRYTRS